MSKHIKEVRKLKRNLKGQFKRQIKKWSPDNFEEGLIGKCRGYERFWVYLPDHPRASKLGYVLRSIVAYEFYHNIQVTREYAVHHRDGNTLNDSKENLELMRFEEHSAFHRSDPESWIERRCEQCGKKFKIRRCRLNQKNHRRGRFCSQECFHVYSKGINHPRYRRVTTICKYCDKPFVHIPSEKRRFCCNSCSAKYQWEHNPPRGN